MKNSFGDGLIMPEANAKAKHFFRKRGDSLCGNPEAKKGLSRRKGKGFGEAYFLKERPDMLLQLSSGWKAAPVYASAAADGDDSGDGISSTGA